MRRTCEQKRRIKRLLLVACAGACAALLLYCVPKWVFLVIAGGSLLLAGWRLFAD